MPSEIPKLPSISTCTVRELCELLQHMPQGAVVALSTDAEGNAFRTLGSHSMELGELLHHGRVGLDYEGTTELLVLWPA